MIALYIAGVFGGLSIVSAITALYLFELEVETTTDPDICEAKALEMARDAYKGRR